MLARIKTLDECLKQGLLVRPNRFVHRSVEYVSICDTFIVNDMLKDFGTKVELLEHLETEVNYVYRANGKEWYIPKDCVAFSGWRVSYASKT